MAVTLYTAQGEPFSVDDEDAPLVERFIWRYHKSVGALFTSISISPYPSAKRGNLLLRNLIMGSSPEEGMWSCTISGDPYCMEKANLAWLDLSTFCHWTRPIPPQRNYRGVHESGRRWRAGFCGRPLGVFNTAEEAALAYDQAARKRHGPWARMNFPGPGCASSTRYAIHAARAAPQRHRWSTPASRSRIPSNLEPFPLGVRPRRLQKQDRHVHGAFD